MTGTNFRHIAKYLISCVLLCVAVHVNARVFEAGEVIYVKKNPSNWSWYGNNDSDGKFAYFYKEGGSSSAWSEEARTVDQCDDVFKIVVPAGDWTHVILTRNSVHSNPDWSNVYNIGDDNTVNKSADIKIPDNQNYLDNFRQYKDANDHPSDKWHWSDCYFYRPTVDPASVTQIDQADKEIIEVCTQSSGDPLSLQPRLINATDGYDYVQGRTWFKWDGVKWKELPYANGDWGFSGPGGLNETIGASGSHTYYFLSTKDHAKERFIEISVTKDCSPTCEITDFGVVTSSVNVHDSTYTLDGVVAFGEAMGKTLHISVTDAKGEHHIDYDPKTTPVTTPFIFSLSNLYADGATITATASFINGGSECSRNSLPYPAPNAINGIKSTIINLTHGETKTVGPEDSPGPGGYKWHDGYTAGYKRPTDSYCFDTTVIYTYYEYEPKPTVAGNLIENGDFSAGESYYGSINRTKNITGSAISEYNFWGKEVTSGGNFYNDYMDEGNSLFGGFSIVTDANSFWKRYTKRIEARKGTYYALFDADNSGEKKAWYVNTGKSSNLKLVKGTNYMFSFWVANINNYGEMNNAAKLQFAIRYKQDGTWSTEELLGNPIDLNDYQDNIWHQNSHVYTSPVDADEVEIMVRDLNTSTNPGGNDFALDDIQFQAISVHSQAIKNCERFVVNILEPAVTVNPPVITITKTPECGDTKFTMEVKLNYSTLNDKYPITLQLTDDVYGNLFSTPITINPATNPDDITLTLSSSDYSKLVADGKEHSLTARIIRDDCKGVDKGGISDAGTYTAPGVPSLTVTEPEVPSPTCDQTTFSLDVQVNYAYLTGTELLFYWDGELHAEATKTITYGALLAEPISTTLTNLTYDGNEHTLLVCTNLVGTANEALDCQDSKKVAAPFSPLISDYVATPKQMGCDIKKYDVEVTFTVANGQGKEVTVQGKGQTKTFTTKERDNSVTFEDIDTYTEDDFFEIWFKDADDKCKKKAEYKEPITPHITVSQGPAVGETDCDKTTYTVKFDIAYTNQNGKLYAWIDDDKDNKTEFPYKENQLEEDKVTIALQELPGDGLKHTIHVEFDGDHGCELFPYETYKAPFSPTISEVNIDRNEMKCDETEYKVTVTATLSENAIGRKLTITGDTGKDPFLWEVDKTDFIHEFTVTRSDATGIFHIYFEDAENCESQKKKQYTYTIPKVPTLSIDEPIIVPAPKCDQTTFDLTISGSFSYLHGSELQFMWDGEQKAKQNITPLTAGSVSATLKGLAYDGGSHTLRVQSNEDEYDICPFELNGIDVAFSPTISDIKVSKPKYSCGDDKYEIELSICYANGLNRKIYINEGSTELAHFTTINDADSHTAEPIEVKLDFDAAHDLKVFFEGFETACPHSINIPSVAKALHGDTTAYYCAGSSFEWHGALYTTADVPPTHTYPSKVTGCDSIVTLHLRTTPLPTLMVCSDTEIDPGESVLLWATGADFLRWEPENSIEMTADYERYAHPTTTTTYTVTGYNLHANRTGNLVYNGDFELGNTGFISDCQYVAPYTSHTKGCYTISDDVKGMWSSLKSVKAYGGSGLMIVADGATVPNSIVWQQQVSVEPNTHYVLSAQFMSLLNSNKYGQYALFQFDVNGQQVGPIFHSPTTLYEWEQFYNIWYSGSSTTATITIYNQNSSGAGNDFALDEIRFEPLNEGCEASKTVTISVRGTRTDSVEIANICRGETYTWHEQTFTEAITITETLTNVAGGDSVCTLILSVSEPTDSIEIAHIFTGQSYTWHGQTFTATTTQTETLTNAAGCDSICTLKLTVSDKLIYDSTETYVICKGETIDWYDGLLQPTASGKIASHTFSGDEKDTLVILDVTVHPTYNLTDEEVVRCEGDEFVWEKETYTTTDFYTRTLQTIHGCDSIVSRQITFNKPTDSIEIAHIFTGQSYTWHGQTFTATTTQTETLTNAAGCDSICTLKLTVSDKLIYDSTETYVICKGETIDWYDGLLQPTASGKIASHTFSGDEKDTLVILDVTVHPTYNLTDEEVVRCEGDEVVWEKETYTTTDFYTRTLKTIHGCDSIVSRQITFNKPTDSIEIAHIFTGQSYTWHGQTFTATTTQTETLTNAAGCDSICTLKLTVSDKLIYDSTEMYTICKGETIDWYDGLLQPTASGKIASHTFSGDEKDTLVILDVTVHPTYNLTDEEVVRCEGDEVVWEKETYTTTDFYTRTLQTIHGCDSIVSRQITFIEALNGDTIAHYCQGTPFEWHGAFYTAAGVPPTHIYTSKVAPYCDSIVTLKLVEYPTYDMPAEEATIIDGETYTWNGTEYGIDVYERPGLYQDKLTLPTVHGCDSIVTLNLTVQENNVENVALNIAKQCAGEGALEIAIQHTGLLDSAWLTFDNKAIQAGFVDSIYPIENDTVIVPYNVKAGIFSVNIDLLFHNRLKYSTSEPKSFTLLFPSTVLEQRWMDAIFVLTHDYNGEYDFTDFQWYKDNVKLVGETGPYLYQPLEVGAEYSAELTEVNSGIRLMTCPLIVTEHTDITLYPTVVTRKDMLRVHVSQDARLTMYSLMGERVSARALIHGDTQIEAPTTQGVYLAEVVLESGLRKVFKIMVR